MILALLWTGGPNPSGAECRALAQAGRYIAAGGHTLLLAGTGGPAFLAAEAYREAGGPHLAALLPEGAAAPPSFFHAIAEGIPAAQLPEEVARRGDALLFLGPPEPSQLAAARAAGKPAYAVASLMSGSTATEGLRLLPDIGAFARELAKLFSRSIVSRPDPMGRRLKGERHNT